MARWTKEGWALLNALADNAVAYTGYPSSGKSLMKDADDMCNQILHSKALWKKISNIHHEDRYWHPFHKGKVLIWKTDALGPIFIGAFYSLPSPLMI